MTDFVQALAAALATIRASTQHAETCQVVTVDINPHDAGLFEACCTCDWAERVDQAQAERWAASVEATAREALMELWAYKQIVVVAPETQAAYRGAALRAAKGEP